MLQPLLCFLENEHNALIRNTSCKHRLKRESRFYKANIESFTKYHLPSWTVFNQTVFDRCGQTAASVRVRPLLCRASALWRYHRQSLSVRVRWRWIVSGLGRIRRWWFRLDLCRSTLPYVRAGCRLCRAANQPA